MQRGTNAPARQHFHPATHDTRPADKSLFAQRLDGLKTGRGIQLLPLPHACIEAAWSTVEPH